MPPHFTVKFVWAPVAIVAAGGSPAFAEQAPNSEVRVCQHQAGKIVSSKGPLRLTVSRDGVTAGSGGTALAAAARCVAPVASTAQGGVVTRGVSDQPAVKDAPKKR